MRVAPRTGKMASAAPGRSENKIEGMLSEDVDAACAAIIPRTSFTDWGQPHVPSDLRGKPEGAFVTTRRSLRGVDGVRASRGTEFGPMARA